jgi:hypothetical protein
MPSIINAATSGGLISTADTSGVLQLQTASTTAMTVTAGQLVGVGTASPTNRLQVAGGISATSSSPAFQASAAIMDVSAGVARFNATGADNSTNGIMTFNTASANAGVFNERMRIAADGYLYIGRTSDTDAQGITLGNDGFIRANRNGGTAMVANRNTNNGVLMSFRQAGNTVGTVDVTTTGTTYTGTNGVTFTATQTASADANTLDDYEEGTFTPTATAGTPGGTPPTFGYAFRYTKIGRVVSITGFFSIGSAGTASGNLNFTGFPFSSGSNGFAPIGTATEQALTNQLCQMRIENNSTSGRVTAVSGGGVVWTTGGQYVISITYFVD